MTEKDWQAQVLEVAALYGWMSYHTYDSRRSSPGFPDLVLVHPRAGVIIYAELKTEKGRISPAQQRWLDALHAADQQAYVWRPSDFDRVHHVLNVNATVAA